MASAGDQHDEPESAEALALATLNAMSLEGVADLERRLVRRIDAHMAILVLVFLCGRGV